MAPHLKLFYSPESTPAAATSVGVRLGDLLPLLTMAQRFKYSWIKDFIDEIRDGGERNQGNFDDGAWVQEVINAVELSFHERRWVDLPLE